MAKRRSDSPELGRRFGRPDIERVGVFSELSYSGEKARPRKKIQMEPRNMYSDGRKSKNGTQHGYFETQFKRVFESEALRGRGRKSKPQKTKNVSQRPFLPPIGFKQHSCPGDYYGTFSGVIEALGNVRRKAPPRKHEGRNIMGNPPKMGGPGYANICINRFPEHKADRYGLKPKYKQYGSIIGRPMVAVHHPQPCFDKNPFADPEGMTPGPTYVRPKVKKVTILPPGHLVPTGPGKKQGGCHGGCFNKFPEHQSDRSKVKAKTKSEPVFAYSGNGMKSYYNRSIVFHNVDIRVNAKSFQKVQPTYSKYICGV